MRLFRILGRDESGATAVEFAFIAPALCLTLLGLFDLGYQSYVGSVMQGALHEAARAAAVGGQTQAEIDARVEKRLQAFSRDAEIDIVPKSYAEFSGIGEMETRTTDLAPLGGPLSDGDCWIDVNDNDLMDERGADNLGGAEDVVYYEVTMTYPRIVPLGGLMGLPDDVTIRSTTVLRNQPFGPRAADPGCKTYEDE